MMEKKHTDEKNYLSVRIKWCALLAAGLVGAFLVRMWVVCIREMQSLMVPVVFTALSAALAVIVYRTVLIPYRETRKIYEQFVMGYVMEDLFKVRYPFSPESEQAVLRLNEIIDRNNLIAISKKQAEYLALQNQINPHFLYNTLDMISWMGYGASNADICKVVASLSDFFRLSLNKGEDSFTLADELNHVKSYITIQEYRMRHIQFRLEAPRELLNLRVPKLMVQPLVENAILHGLRPRNYRGHITISCALEQAYLVIRVMDDGVGFDEKLLGERTEKSTSYGLKNIRQRLAVLYDDRGSLEIANRPEGGVVARLRYPAEKGAPAGGKGGAE